MDLVKGKVMARITGEFFDSVNGDFWGVVEIVDDDGLEAAEEKLKHGVATDVTGSASDQNALRHGMNQKARIPIPVCSFNENFFFLFSRRLFRIETEWQGRRGKAMGVYL